MLTSGGFLFLATYSIQKQTDLVLTWGRRNLTLDDSPTGETAGRDTKMV